MSNQPGVRPDPSTPAPSTPALWTPAPASGRRRLRLTLAAALMAGAAACSASPRYPISLGEPAGEGGILTAQPRYPVSAADAAQNAAEVRDGRAYPAYGAAPVGAAATSPYAPPPPARAAADPAVADDDPADGVSAPRGLQPAPVESADLPPPPAAAGADSGAMPAGAPPPPPPADDAPPHAEAIAFGGGQIVFGTDAAGPPLLELAAYRRHRAKADASTTDEAPTAAKAEADAKPSRRRRGKAAADTQDDAPPAVAAKGSAADTPYQTVVRPGEKLGDVAERTGSSRDALTQLNDLKHPRHVKAGTVLKIPYRYSYEVQKGDTLYTISHRFGQDPAAMAKLNGLKAVPTLQPGQSLSLPSDAHDEGKRDHAAASGPAPEAAPTRLADAALKKAERRDRRHHRAAPAAEPVQTAEASPAPEAEPSAATAAPHAASAPTGRGRRHRRGAAPVQTAEAAPTPAPLAVAPPPQAQPQPVRPRTAVATAQPSAPVALPTPPNAGTVAAAGDSEPASPTPPASAPTPSTYAGVRPTPPPAYAGVRPTPSPAYAGVRPSTGASAAASAATPSIYAAPSYAARTGAAPVSGQVASLNTPRYSPAYPAGGYAPSLGRERPVAQTPTAGAVSSAQIASAGRGRFIWPLRGPVSSAFGDKPSGEHNDGLDISAPPGSGVKAAAGGEVVYAGSAIPGYGNLVLVKHPGGWVTAYAHLDRIEVRMKDSVGQGDEIGQAGQTLAGSRPGLHFEVRYAPGPTDKARPVDPSLVLPAG